MRKCEDCKIILDNDARHCPECGKEVDGGLEQQLPSVEVGALVTSANLHRVRQEWDQAIEDAASALRLDPKNSDIASLLGMIYEQRDMPEEAAVWYRMALDMNPRSVADKARLQRVSGQVGRSGKRAPAASHMRPWFWAAVATVAVVALLFAVVLGLGKYRWTGTSGASRAKPTSAKANPVLKQPRAAAPPRAQAKSDAGKTEQADSSAPLRTPAEVHIESEVAAAPAVQQTGASIDDVIADPRQGIATVTFSLPAGTLVNRAQIIRAAAGIARAAFETNRELKFVTARCLAPAAGSSGTQVAFVGDVARVSIDALDENADEQQIQAIFTQPWWNPQIR